MTEASKAVSDSALVRPQRMMSPRKRSPYGKQNATWGDTCSPVTSSRDLRNILPVGMVPPALPIRQASPHKPRPPTQPSTLRSSRSAPNAFNINMPVVNNGISSSKKQTLGGSKGKTKSIRDALGTLAPGGKSTNGSKLSTKSSRSRHGTKPTIPFHLVVDLKTSK
jgi:hypothetical protein